MIYSDTTNKSGVIQAIEQLCDLGDGYITSDTNRLKYFTSIVNRVYSRIWHIIFLSTGMWAYDDRNHTDFPASTTDLVKGQGGYILPPASLTVKKIKVKKDNNWVELTRSAKGVDDEYLTKDGTPYLYSLVGNVVNLYPAPDYNLTDGLKVYYDRDNVAFKNTDTNKPVGFASPYHEILPIKASIEWFKIKQPNSPTLQGLIMDDQRLEQSLRQFYSVRLKQAPKVISRRKESFK